MNITIDTKSLAQEFALSQNQIEKLVSSVIDGLTLKASERWKLIASQELSSTRDLYINSLIIGEEGPYIGYVMMVSKNPLPIMLEIGVQPFDMKEGFSHSSKIRIKKGSGWYLTIPFRFASSTSLGESSIFSGKLPKEIEILAKKLSPKETLKINKIPEQYQIPKTREFLKGKNKKGEEVEFKTYIHKTSIYEGLQHTKLSGSERHNMYSSFRRVSDTSDFNSWIFPGLIAKNFRDKTLKSMDLFQEIDKLIDSYLYKEGFGNGE